MRNTKSNFNLKLNLNLNLHFERQLVCGIRVADWNFEVQLQRDIVDFVFYPIAAPTSSITNVHPVPFSLWSAPHPQPPITPSILSTLCPFYVLLVACPPTFCSLQQPAVAAGFCLGHRDELHRSHAISLSWSILFCTCTSTLCRLLIGSYGEI